MDRIIGLAEARQSFDRVLAEAARDNTSIVVAEDGRPTAVVMPHAEFARLRKLAGREAQLLARFDAMWTRRTALDFPYTDDEIADDIEAAREEVHALRTAQPVGENR